MDVTGGREAGCVQNVSLVVMVLEARGRAVVQVGVAEAVVRGDDVVGFRLCRVMVSRRTIVVLAGSLGVRLRGVGVLMLVCQRVSVVHVVVMVVICFTATVHGGCCLVVEGVVAHAIHAHVHHHHSRGFVTENPRTTKLAQTTPCKTYYTHICDLNIATF